MDHTIALIQRSHEGDEEARARLVEENAGLVWCIVKRFHNRGVETEDLFQIGIITGTHGLKGEVKVFPTTDDKERFLDLDTVLIDTGKELIEKKVQYCKFFKQFVFVKFEGLNDINDVEKYKRCPLKVTRENAVPLEEDEYYVADLLGLTIVDESGVTIGELVDVIETGANDVYEVKTSDGGHVLLPAINIYNLVLMRNFFEGIPQSLFEAATLDGCTPMATFIKVVLPLSKAALASIGLMFAVAYWNDYTNYKLYITDSSLYNFQMKLRSIMMGSDLPQANGGATENTVKSAAIIIAILPFMILYPFLQKYFVKGVNVGAVKG